MKLRRDPADSVDCAQMHCDHYKGGMTEAVRTTSLAGGLVQWIAESVDHGGQVDE